MGPEEEIGRWKVAVNQRHQILGDAAVRIVDEGELRIDDRIGNPREALPPSPVT